MKKVAVFIFLAALLLVPATASAGIPGIQQTSQYKSLQSYSTFLQGQSSTPVSTSQKEIYQTTLNQRATNALNRVNSLYQQRKNKVLNSHEGNLKKAIKRINNSRKKNLAKAKSWYIDATDEEKAVYQGVLQAIYSKYDSKINKINKKIAKTEKQLAKTTDPIKVDTLESELDLLNTQKESLMMDRQDAKNIAYRNYKITIQEEKATYKRKQNRINSRANNNIRLQKRQRLAKLDGYLANIENRKVTEAAMVNGLVSSGQAAIDAMPPLVT